MVCGAAQASQTQVAADLGDLSIEELANLQISSVSKRPQPLSSAASAVYAITNDDIRRSGFTSLTDVLRLAPNLQVGRIAAYQQAVSARGFNGFEASNKLLVLIDGRSVYSPLHSGVFWDAQDVMLEDVERIEVISGPGGTLWGANAVNGVINIITKNSADTQGGLVSGTYGSLDRHAAARYGGAIGDSATYRVYVKGTYFNDSELPNGDDWGDDWRKIQGGVAVDWKGEDDTLAVKGDIYDSELDIIESTISGLNAQVHWTHHFADGSPLDVQAYYDRARRIAPPGIDEVVEAYNLDVQHNFMLGAGHNIVWGGGYRVTDDYFDNGSPFVLVEPFGTLKLGNVFIQDEVALTDTLSFTAGLKLEHHTYTGWEYMPNVRLAWEADRDIMLWAAVSRAVRTPSRIDRELSSPGILLPADNFKSETLIAYEAGYRGQPAANATLSVSVYYNDYDKIRTTAFGPGNTFPLMFMNAIEGHTYGVEAWGNYEVVEWWRLSAGMNFIHKNLRVKPGIVDLANMQAAGNDPGHQVLLRSQMNPVEDVELDVGLRIVDDLPNPAIDGYTELDVRLGWHLTDTLELSLAGLNLLHDRHPESGTPAQRGEVPRSVYAGARWSF